MRICHSAEAGDLSVRERIRVDKRFITFQCECGQTIRAPVERAGAKAGNKGFDAAVAAIEMANLVEQL